MQSSLKFFLVLLLTVFQAGSTESRTLNSATGGQQLQQELQDYFLSIVGTECFDLSAPRPYRLSLLVANVAEHAGTEWLNEFYSVARQAIKTSNLPLQLNIYSANSDLASIPFLGLSPNDIADELSRQLDTPLLLIAKKPADKTRSAHLTVFSRNALGQFPCNSQFTITWSAFDPAGTPAANSPPPSIQGDSNCGNIVVGQASDTSIIANMGC